MIEAGACCSSGAATAICAARPNPKRAAAVVPAMTFSRDAQRAIDVRCLGGEVKADASGVNRSSVIFMMIAICDVVERRDD